MSSIEWTNETWNPITGCTRVSPGCEHCYAERMSHRLRAMGVAKYADAVDERGRWTGKMTLDEAALELPLRWRKPRLVFVNSMSDLFHETVPDEWFEQVWEVMEMCPEHTFQILTKRPERMLELLHRNDEQRFDRGDYSCEPLPNVWLGVSAEDQRRFDERVPHLLDVCAARRFVSCEPLLGPIDISLDGFELPYWCRCAACDAVVMCPDADLCPQCGVEWNMGADVSAPTAEEARWKLENMGHFSRDDGLCRASRLDWVIVGGESGPGARPMNLDWARDIRDQCQAPYRTVPFFLKQLGGHPDKRGGEKALLDGRLWREMPRE